MTRPIVMAGLVPAIHVLLPALKKEDVDARHKAGHDGGDVVASVYVIAPTRSLRG
jgi:hypothetical protein